MSQVPHPKEAENRLAKAQRLLAHIDTVMPEATSNTLMLLGDAAWDKFATDAGEAEDDLSKSTISTVIALVRGRELAIAAVRQGMVAR